MTPEDLAALRRMVGATGLVSLTARELSTLLLDRDHHAAEARALREAIRAYLAVDGSEGKYEAIRLYDAREVLRALLAQGEG